MPDISRIHQYAIRNTQYALLLAFALRLFRLDFQELRGDEAFGYFFSLRPFDEIVAATLSLQEPHPVGSYFLQHLWLGWAGDSEFALRFVSVWFGTLAVALLHRLARRLGLTAGVANTGALLLAAGPYAIWHSQDARMYSMLLALTLGSTWLMAEALQRGRAAVWLLYAGVSWLALHTHYFAVFVLAGQSCFVVGRALFMPRVRFAALQFVQWQFVVALLYLPWYFTAAETLRGYGGNGDSPGFGGMAVRALAVFAGGESIPAGRQPAVAVGAALLIGLGGLALWREGAAARRTLLLLLLLWAGPVLATWVSAWERPIFNERYLIAAAPPFYLLLAVALSHALRHRQYAIRNAPAVLVLLLFLLSLSNHYTDPAYSKTRGWRALAAVFAQLSAGLPPEQVRLAQNFPDPTLWYYYDGPPAHIVLPPGANDAAGAQAAVAQLAAAGVSRVILPVQPAAWWDGSGIASAALAERYALTAQKQVGVWPVAVYSRAPAPLPRLEAEFVNGLRLTGTAVEPGAATPGGLLVVYLAWDGRAAALRGRETVFLHLLDGAGQIVAQADVPLQAAPVEADVQAYGILLPEALPAAPFRLVGGLYDPSQPGAARVMTRSGADTLFFGSLKDLRSNRVQD